MDIFETCPVLENDRYRVRLIEQADANELMDVYHDRLALPFFNSDNCHGSNFYCENREDMENTIKYWLIEYHENRGFVRFTVIDRQMDRAIGTLEMFRREASDFYDGCGILRMDFRSDCERADVVFAVLSLICEPFFAWFGCDRIATKAAVYAVERIEALKRAGFVKSEEPVIGMQDRAYYDYWLLQK